MHNAIAMLGNGNRSLPATCDKPDGLAQRDTSGLRPR